MPTDEDWIDLHSLIPESRLAFGEIIIMCDPRVDFDSLKYLLRVALRKVGHTITKIKRHCYNESCMEIHFHTTITKIEYFHMMKIGTEWDEKVDEFINESGDESSDDESDNESDDEPDNESDPSN